MFHDIMFNGFQPPVEIVKWLRQDLSRLLELCPSDSAIDTEITKKAGRFEMLMTVHYMGGEFISFSHGPGLKDAVKNGLDKIYEQIRFWREGRTKEMSWLATLSEFSRGVTGLETPTKVAPRVLIVDDEISSTRVVSACLNKLGCVTSIASSGREAIEKIVSEPYDLVVLDWTMQDMNGGEALVRAEKLNSRNPVTDYQWSALRLPVITYSGRTRQELEYPDCKHFRFMDHWQKSAPYSQLLYRASQTLSQIQLEPRFGAE